MKMSGAISLICAIASASAAADTNAVFTLPSGVKIQISEAPFEKASFKVSGCINGRAPCTINGHIPFGSLDLPKTYVKKISISYQGQSYSLNASDMYDAWGERPLEYKGALRYFGGKCSDTKNCQFRGLFSDGASSYVAEWEVVDGVATRTVLSNSDDIVNLFKQHIDPPVFD